VQRFDAALGRLPTAADPTREPSAETRAGKRLRIISEALRRGPGSLHEAVPAAAALDAEELENRYVMGRAYVWILPVLGFIGTAWGMSQAIAGFSEGLAAGEGQGIQFLADRLAQLVIPNLSNAFFITMLALGASAIGHYCLTKVHWWDSEVLRDLDQSCARVLASWPKPAENLENAVVALAVASQGVVQAAAKLSEAAAAMEHAAAAMHATATRPYYITLTREPPK